MSFEVKVDGIMDADAILAQFGLEEGGIVQQVIDKAVIDYCMP